MNSLMNETITIKPVENVVDIKYSFADGTHTTKLTFADGTVKYIIIELGMIFVSDWPEEELSQHINADECLSYEAYDTTDGCSYYLDSEYAAEISDALLNLAGIYLKQFISK